MRSGAKRSASPTCNAAMNVYLFGDHAPATVATETPKWEAWMQATFPAPAGS